MQQKSPFKIIVQPQRVTLGGMSIRRSLPYHQNTMIGPWIFFDHFGPTTFSPQQGVDVAPHPHINLATVTYLFDGQLIHCDSLASQQIIEPGAINLMVAGQGISHSERTPSKVRLNTHQIHGIQLWHALPDQIEECEPAFYHYEKDLIPHINEKGVEARVLIGSAFQQTSPVISYCDTLYMYITMEKNTTYTLPQKEELAVYILEGQVSVNDLTINPLELGVLNTKTTCILKAHTPAQLILIGGEKMPTRYIEWNFVSSTQTRIKQAIHDWNKNSFPPVLNDQQQ